MKAWISVAAILFWFQQVISRDEDKIMKACYWPNEIYEPCFGGCAEVSCDNPRNHQRPCYPYCEPGCVCADPYVRDDRTHECVMPHECTPTQMGIPVPPIRRLPPPPKHNIMSRPDVAMLRQGSIYDHNESLPPIGRMERLKGGAEMSRMGNYFNIVIAPPPIKTLSSRKMLQNQKSHLPTNMQ